MRGVVDRFRTTERPFYLKLLVSVTVWFSISVGVSSAENWSTGTWDASDFPFINGHPTTIALRIEVLDGQSGNPIANAETRLEGTWKDDDGLQHDLRLTANTDSDGIAVVGLGWRDEQLVTAIKTANVTDDIEKVQRLIVRKSGYSFAKQEVKLSGLKQDRDAWKAFVTDTPGVKYFMLKTGETFRHGRKTSSDPLFFEKVRKEDYHKVMTADYFPNGQLGIPTFRDRLTIGPFIVMNLRIQMQPTVTNIQIQMDKTP